MIKNFSEFINKKLTLNDRSKMSKYRYQPKNKEELEFLLERLIEERGPKGDFNDIDTSLITDMSKLFYDNKTFNGNISEWDTSNVTNMHGMFCGATSFNQPIGEWNTSKVTSMNNMFADAISFNQDISNWTVKNVKFKIYIFTNCPIKDSHKPKFK